MCYTRCINALSVSQVDVTVQLSYSEYIMLNLSVA